jgi:hypothetical protein
MLPKTILLNTDMLRQIYRMIFMGVLQYCVLHCQGNKYKLRVLFCHSRMGKEGNAYGLLVGKTEGKIPLGRPRRRCVDNIRMDLGEVGWGDVAQDRNRWRAPVNSVLNLRVPRNAGKLSSGLTTVGLSSSAQLHRVILPHYNDLTFNFKFWLKFLVTCTYSLFGMYCSACFIFK